MNLGIETEKIEFKKSIKELNKGIISLVAMLNKSGEGTIYFGVKNNGDIIGQSDANENMVRNVIETIKDAITPQITPIVGLVLINNKIIVKIEAKGNNTPYSAFGKYYCRSFDIDKRIF